MSMNGGTNQLAALLKVPHHGLVIHLGGRLNPASLIEEALVRRRVVVILAVGANLEQLVVRKSETYFGMLTKSWWSLFLRALFEKQSLVFSFLHWSHWNFSWTWTMVWVWPNPLLAAPQYFWFPRAILRTVG